MGLRAGSKVLVWRGDAPTPALPVHGEGVGVEQASLARGEGEEFPPCTGGLKGGRYADPSINSIHTHTPIENLNPNDHVLGHDGLPHPIIRIIKTSYQGELIGIGLEHSSQNLWLTPDQKVLCLQRPRTLGGQNDWSGSPKVNAARRKELRSNQTPAEKRLWSILRKEQLGVKFRRQHSIGPYIADFYSREAAMVIECDGGGHCTEESRGYDRQRDQYMYDLGLNVLRFDNDAIINNIESVYEVITSTIKLSLNDPAYAVWTAAHELCKGDKVCSSFQMTPLMIEKIESESVSEVVYALEIQSGSSFLTEMCAVSVGE